MKSSREKRRQGLDGRPGVLGALGAMLTAGLLTACMSGYDVPADFPCPQENLKGTYTLDLKIAAGNLSARSSGHGNVAGDAAENFINVSSGDYAVFIFDGAGNFVQRFEPGAVSLERDGTDDYVYRINGAFRPENELDEVQIMVLANWRTDFGGDYLEVEGKMSASGRTNSLNYLYGNAADFNFTLPVRPATSGGGASSEETDSAWFPVDNTSGIPMFGLSEKINMNDKTMLGNSIVLKTDNPIPMLRSLAKIEIVDMVPNGSANIERCVLTTYNKTGRFIPDVIKNPNWNGLDRDKTQVISPSLPADLTQSGGGQSVPAGEKLQFQRIKRNVLIDGKTDEKDCFVVYVPEMDIVGITAADKKPVLKVYIKDVEEPYTVYLSPYDSEDGKPVLKEDGSVAYYDGLLRNHVYRYNINSVGIEAQLTLHIDTDQWDNDEDEYYYDDVEVAFKEENKFKWNWDNDNVDPLDPYHFDPVWDGEAYPRDNISAWPKEALLSLWKGKNLVVEKSGASAAEATFTITKPERGTWTLALYCAEGTPKHWFQIEIWDESSQKWVLKDQRIDPNEHNLIADTMTGTIAPKRSTASEVKIRISAQDLQYSDGPYSARLVMNVTTFDGRMAEVNLITGKLMQSSEESSDDYYYIKQYPTPTE